MNISMFDILGPIMIGPSSSHTAGAQRIGKAMYNMIADKQLQAVHFILHGSFHLTLRGHGTDRALVGGVLGMNAYDPQLKNSLEIAKERGIEVTFEGADLGDVHPNTVRIIAQTTDGTLTTLTGSSVGGGEIEIVDINGTPAKFSGRYPGWSSTTSTGWASLATSPRFWPSTRSTSSPSSTPATAPAKRLSP